MIPKTCLLLVLSVAWEVSGASYSNVIVQTGPEPAPAVEYYAGLPLKYEYASPQIAQYKAPINYEYPLGSTSYSYRTATAYAEPTIAAVAPAAPSANVVYPGYTAPVSTLYSGLNSPTGYEFSYVLLNTGTEPELRQLNEGEIIRGGYTFLQPDGLVQYVAENNQGFNAIFKNYLPNEEVKKSETAHHKPALHETAHHEIVHLKTAHNAAPCHEAKSAALTAQEGGHEIHEKHAEHESHHIEHESHHAEHEAQHAEHEAHHVEHEAQHAEHEAHHVEHEAHVTEHEARHGGNEQLPTLEHNEHASHIELHESHESETPHHEHNIIIKIQEGLDSESDEPKVEVEHHIHVEHSEEHDVSDDVEETDAHESDDGTHTHESIVEEPHKGHEPQATYETTLAVVPEYPIVGNNVYISYNDFIKCIQAALTRSNNNPYYAPVPKPVSPLNYLYFNKPC